MPPRSAPLGGTRTAPALSARSVLASTLLGARPEGLPVKAMIVSATLFGISDGAARTALSRMVQSGELRIEDRTCTLAGPLADRHARQRRLLAGKTRRWDGTWELALVNRREGRDPNARQALRVAARALSLGSLRDGAWLRPDNLLPDRAPEQRAILHAQCVVARGARLDVDCRDLWDLVGWSERARVLREMIDRRLDALDANAGNALADAFVSLADVIRHLQDDALLPETLLPHDWPGPALRQDYTRFERQFRISWKRQVSDSLRRLRTHASSAT